MNKFMRSEAAADVVGKVLRSMWRASNVEAARGDRFVIHDADLFP